MGQTVPARPALLEEVGRQTGKMLPAGTALLTGEARAEWFGALIDRHGRFLYRVAVTLVRNSADAEDTVQEALLKLYRGDAWQQAVDERAFLAQCVWRAGLDRLGSARARAMRHAEDVTELDLASAAESPEQLAAGAEQRALMQTLIDALPDALRQPLLLSTVEGIRSREVAGLLGIPEGTVRTRLMRARTQLRESFLLATTPGRGRPQRGEVSA